MRSRLREPGNEGKVSASLRRGNFMSDCRGWVVSVVGKLGVAELSMKIEPSGVSP